MTIDYRGDTNAALVARLIEANEGAAYLSPQVIDGNDHTITFGYGYTFVRSGLRYTHLVADLAPLGLVLDQTQLNLLDSIAIAQGQQISVNRAGGTPNRTQTDNLINQFVGGWQQPNITLTQADGLRITETGHLSARLERSIRGYLSGEPTADVDALMNSLINGTNGTREWAAIVSYGFVAETLVGPGLARALFDGDRAEAWFQIRYGWDNNNTTFNQGWVNRHYLESEVFGLYNNQTSTADAFDVYRMIQLHRARIEDYESLYSASERKGQAWYIA